MNPSGPFVEKVNLTTIWIRLLNNREEENLLGEELEDLSEIMFGEKADHLRAIIPFKWKGKNLGDLNAKQWEIYPGIRIYHQTKNLEKINWTECPGKLSALKKKMDDEFKAEIIEKENKIIEKENGKPRPPSLIEIPLPDNGRWRQEKSFTFIDIMTKGEPSDIASESSLILPILLFEDTEAENVKVLDVYREVGMVLPSSNTMFNISSLKSCFLTVDPRSVLLVRKDNVKDNSIRNPVFESATVAALCFVAFTSLIKCLEECESCCRSVFSLENLNREQFYEFLIAAMKSVGRYRYFSSFLLGLHSNYVTSSIVGERFFYIFSEITGLAKIERGLLEKLENAGQLLDLIVQYYHHSELAMLLS